MKLNMLTAEQIWEVRNVIKNKRGKKTLRVARSALLEAQAKLTSKQYIPDDWKVVGVAFRFFPGGVYCDINYSTEAGFDKVIGCVTAGEGEIENYDRQLFAAEAYSRALKQLTG